MRRIIRIEAGINFFTNALLNALCAWLLYRKDEVVAVDAVSLCIDTCITCFCISLLTTFFASLSAKRYLKSEVFVSKDSGGRRPFPLALFFAFVACVPLCIVFVACFSLCGVTYLPVSLFILYKGIWGGIFGSTICVLVLSRYQCKVEGESSRE